MGGNGPLGRARAAYEGRDWAGASEEYRAAEDAGARLAGPDLECWAYAALWTTDIEAAISTFERAEEAYKSAEDRERAAIMCIASAQVSLWTGRNTEASAGMQRLPELLDGLEDCEAHALLDWVTAFQTAEQDAATSLALWEKAVATARRVGSRTAEAASLGDLGRALLQTGERDRGLNLVEQAAAMALSGDVRPLAAGHVLCGTIWAFRDLGDWRAAAEWADITWRWVARTKVSIYPGLCRFHRCEVIRVHGDLDAAEREALASCQELERLYQPRAGYAYRELGEIRFRRGDLEGAGHAFERAIGFGVDPQPGLARLRLARGEVEGALRGLEDALATKGARAIADRPFVLAVLVEAAVAAGDMERARQAARDLRQIADVRGSEAHRAAADEAAGSVALASGDLTGARRLLRSAWELWSEVEAPFEASTARVLLARVSEREGDLAEARLDLAAARSGFERIGARLEVTRLDGLLNALGREEEARDSTRRGDPASSRAVASEEGPPREAVLQRAGEYWTVGLGARIFRLRDVKGLHYLAYLLAHPAREFHALDLLRAVEPPPAVEGGRDPSLTARASAQGDLGPALDPRATEAYTRRLMDLREDLDEAESMNDPERASLARREIDALSEQLASAIGLGGNARPSGSDAERARVKVTRLIKHAIKRIGENDAELGHLLRSTIATGTFCSYAPPPGGGPAWSL